MAPVLNTKVHLWAEFNQDVHLGDFYRKKQAAKERWHSLPN